MILGHFLIQKIKRSFNVKKLSGHFWQKSFQWAPFNFKPVMACELSIIFSGRPRELPMADMPKAGGGNGLGGYARESTACGQPIPMGAREDTDLLISSS